MFNLILQSDWLAGEFRDCNGESNGMELPEDVIQDEGNCSDNKAGSNKTSRQSSTSNELRIQPLVKPRNIYITPSPFSSVATATSRHYIGGLRQKKSLTFPEDKRLPDKIVSDVLGRRKFENRFILQNNQRSWSGWSSFSQSSSSSVVRRNLRIRANNNNNKRNSTEAVSCQFDTIKGGCRIENRTSVVSYPKFVRLGTTTASTTTERSSTPDTTRETTATTKKQTTNGFSFQNLRKHQNKIKEEIKRLVESKMNNNRRIDIDEGFDTLNLGSNQDEELDLPEKEDTTTEEAMNQEEESIPDFVVPFSVLQKNKIFKSDNENDEEELSLSLEVEVDKLRKELSKLKAILEAKPQKKKILKKIKTVVKVKTTTSKPQTLTKTTSTTTAATTKTTTKKTKKRKNYNEYPRIWDGPQPNCAWDGPGGCGGGFADYYEDLEENFENPSAGSRLPDVSSRRIDIDDDIQEFVSLHERDNEEDKFDKSKLLPGKNIKDKIREHLRKKELREKKGNQKPMVTSSVRPGIIQSENRLRDQTISSEDYKIYSVDDWLKMG